MIGDPTHADAILDRLVNNAYRLELKGKSMRGNGAKRAAGLAESEIDNQSKLLSIVIPITHTINRGQNFSINSSKDILVDDFFFYKILLFVSGCSATPWRLGNSGQGVAS
jgi:hypothetical protein